MKTWPVRNHCMSKAVPIPSKEATIPRLNTMIIPEDLNLSWTSNPFSTSAGVLSFLRPTINPSELSCCGMQSS